jgi:hypothetical protein
VGEHDQQQRQGGGYAVQRDAGVWRRVEGVFTGLAMLLSSVCLDGRRGWRGRQDATGGQQWQRQRKYIRKGMSRAKRAWRARGGPEWSCCCAGAPRLVVVLMRSEYSRFGLLLANGR